MNVFLYCVANAFLLKSAISTPAITAVSKSKSQRRTHDYYSIDLIIKLTIKSKMSL